MMCDSSVVDAFLGPQVEAGDPTQDEMMCFYKPPFHATLQDPSQPPALARQHSKLKLGKQQPFGKEGGLPKKVQGMLDSVPVGIHEGSKAAMQQLIQGLPALKTIGIKQAQRLPPTQRIMVHYLLNNAIPFLEELASGILRLLEKATVHQVHVSAGTVLPTCSCARA